MSSLPIAEFCGRASGLDTGSGRAAAMSTHFHARCSGKGERPHLTDEEQAEVDTWLRPDPIRYKVAAGHEVELRYEDAQTEVEVAVDENGNHVPASDPTAISVGHLDMGWRVPLPNGDAIAVVGDIKRSEWTTEDGPDSLQLHGYGFAWASTLDAEYYLTAIWAAKEGGWSFGELVDLTDFDSVVRWKRVKRAILNVGGEYNVGPHCRRCYSRWQCPAHLLPPELAETSLAPLTNGGLTKANALHLKVLCDRIGSTLEVAEKALKDFAIQQGGIPDGKGKVWRPVNTRGRESLDTKALEEKLGDLSSFKKRGKDFISMKWTNE